MEYEIKKGLTKAFKYFILFGLPWAVDKFIVEYPQYAQITLGSVLVFLVNLLKVKYGKDVFAFSIFSKKS